MVSNANQSKRHRPVNQGVDADIPGPNKIGASTPYDFEARNLTAYGGLLPVATMLEQLGFQQLVEEALTVKRKPRSMPVFRFVLGMVLAFYVGFSRLNHLRFLKREPMLTGILRVAQLPPQSTFWRFLASLHLGVARQLLTVQWRMRERVTVPAVTGVAPAISMDFSPDAPYYHPIPAEWPRVELPAGYFGLLQLNTNQQGDGIGFGESVATAWSPYLFVTSEWYTDASTFVTFPYHIESNWATQLPSTAAGDEHVIFIDPSSDTFISSYKTSLNTSTGGPSGLYISAPTSFNSLGTAGGSVASEMAELPIMIQPGEATNASTPIPHAISGPVART